MENESTNSLILPQNTAAVTMHVVDCWYHWYWELAEASVEGEAGMVFTTDKERELEINKRILELCNSGDMLNDAIRQKVLSNIARHQLHRHSPENWNTLAGWLRDASDSLSASGASEYAAIAETIAPFCEQHDIDVYSDPTKLGYLREAASGLRAIIKGKSSDKQKAKLVRKELAFVLDASTRAEVRDHFRQVRAEPVDGMRTVLEDGREAMMLVGSPVTIEALAQAADNRMIRWRRGKATIQHADTRPSKIEGQELRPISVQVEMGWLYVINTETGEVIEAVEAT